MAWSWKIGRLAGINIYMHWTFLLLIAFIVYLFISQGSSGTAAALGVLFVLAVFGCVVLHELGHALTARRFGVPTRDIILLPIGGIARMQRMPDHPGQELVVACSTCCPLSRWTAGACSGLCWRCGSITPQPLRLRRERGK